jgi:hypothetical protein
MSRIAQQAAAAAAMAGAAVSMASGWPGMSPETSRQFTRLGANLPVDDVNKFVQTHKRYYHVVDYATTGHTSLTFFNAPKQDHICNLQNGSIPEEQPVWCTGLCVTWQDLTALSSGSPSVTRSGVFSSASATTPFTRAEEVRTILQAGSLYLQISGREVLDVQDLTHFPSDGGAFAPATSISFAAATNAGSSILLNGAPIAGNRFRFTAPWAILPGQVVKCVLSWQTALSVSTAGRFKVELVCEQVSPRNL